MDQAATQIGNPIDNFASGVAMITPATTMTREYTWANVMTALDGTNFAKL